MKNFTEQNLLPGILSLSTWTFQVIWKTQINYRFKSHLLMAQPIPKGKEGQWLFIG
ncbi:hypothetical protein [Panacibacter ginsenosidivorans]|uniref:hypothetical protein n=1 Tax=Panacibacter ginsenosidivorans TaxID=1813871 RepID=UPI00131521AA|nr:hypothetical protein [Panacibacter ginsenosidivorans]